MTRYIWLFSWITILTYVQRSYHWNYMRTQCSPKIGHGNQNISLPPLNNSLLQDDVFEWYIDRPTVTNILCIYYHNEYRVKSNEDILYIKWQCTENHTLNLINLTEIYGRTYYFQSFKTLGQGTLKPNTLCYKVSLHSTHQIHYYTTTLSPYPSKPTQKSPKTLLSLTPTNFTHIAVHYAAGNVEAQHDTATSHTMWIIPLVIVITIIVLICFKFPQKAWNKFTQYRYSGMIAAA